MITLTSYTSYAEIRAALGVSADELPDATLALALYANLLEADLEDISTTLPSTFTTTKAKPTPSADETRFLQAAAMFATYDVAKHLTGSLPLFTLKQETDSKAGNTRFDNPFKDVIAAVNAAYDKSRARLVSALDSIGGTGTTTTSRVYLSVVAPSVNVITGA